MSIISNVFKRLVYKTKIDENLIVLESNPPLADNTGALFDKMIETKLNLKYKIVWLVYSNIMDFPKVENVRYVKLVDKNLFSKYKNKLYEIYWISKSKYYIFSHRKNYKYDVKKGQRIVNLTHGIPIKDSSGKHMDQGNVCDIISTSKFAGELRAYTYDINTDKIRILGYPRNDKLFNLNKSNFGAFAVWLPTYRTHAFDHGENESDNFPLSLDETDFKMINKLLLAYDFKLFIKPHPAQKLDIKDIDLSNIIVIDDNFFNENSLHLYDFLSKSKFLITDYSSVYVDYLLTDKPIIFTFDDLHKYKNDWGFTVENIHDYTPGIKVYDKLDFIAELENILMEKDNFVEVRKEVKDIFHYYQDSDSSARILEYLGIL